jgi:hypothetical protein
MLQDVEYTQPKIMTVSEFESLNLGAPIFVSYATKLNDKPCSPEKEPS